MNSEIPILTKREMQILKLVCYGISNKEIALSLGIKPVTVEFHLKNMYRKLDVTTRTEAVFKAERIGILGTTYGNP